MLRISLTDYRTNESVMNEIDSDGELVSTVRKRKLQYFGHMIRAQNLCTYILKVVWIVQEAEEGHRDDKETGLVRLRRRARQQQETGRAGKN